MKHVLSRYSFLGPILLSSFLLTGCDKSSSEDSLVPDCDTQAAASTFQAIQAVIFEGRQCITCHNSDTTKGDLDLSPEVAHQNLVNAASKLSWVPDSRRVFPGENGLSFLYHKVEAATKGLTLPQAHGQAMPSGGASPLTLDELEALRLWIRGGAPKEGIVAGTPHLLKCGLSTDADPNKVPPLEPPALGEGTQFYAGPWVVAPESEDEVCFATFYDLSRDPAFVPVGSQLPCTEREGGSHKTCYAYNYNMLVQDPQSHHSIVTTYTGTAEPTDADWGPWECLGGALSGAQCDPTKFGESASTGGAECGERSICATVPKSATACIGFGPSNIRANRAGLSGAQSPVSYRTFDHGVYSLSPMKGMIIWNSHAFNLTKKETTVEQYINIRFAPEDEILYRRHTIFDSEFIFVMNVPPFEKREYCDTYTLPENSRLMNLGSHVHKRGTLFRTWLPPNEPCTPGPDCQPNADDPDYTSTIYNDPLYLVFDESLKFNDSDEKTRTIKFCAVFDNGADYPELLKRRSQLTEGASACNPNEMRCLNGPNHNTLCGGNHSACDSTEGAGDGNCDACVVKGGVTTEDEMFILLGSYYVEE